MRHEDPQNITTAENSTLGLTPAATVEVIGPCTEDIADCEIRRAAIANKDATPENTHAQAIRVELASVACAECTKCYLPDISAET